LILRFLSRWPRQLLIGVVIPGKPVTHLTPITVDLVDPVGILRMCAIIISIQVSLIGWRVIVGGVLL
jgi:hypothetical protein